MTDDMNGTEKLLVYMRARPDTVVRAKELTEATGLSQAFVSGTMARAITLALTRPDSEWYHIRKVGHGRYMYFSDSPEMQEQTDTGTGWSEVGQTHDENGFVLRGPDGKLWMALPLVANGSGS